MICVYKEYEVKVKMVQEQWLQIKVNFLLLFNGGGGGRINLWFGGGGGVYWRGFSQVGDEQIFWLVGENDPIPSGIVQVP